MLQKFETSILLEKNEISEIFETNRNSFIWFHVSFNELKDECRNMNGE
jgi:hypothetical protein